MANYGFGSKATGGAGSTTIYRVTNLNSSGAGSLANGIGSNKTIVFDVGGTIIGRHNFVNIKNLTIDGSTAPSPGITINNNNNGDGINIEGAGCSNIIIKDIRVINSGGDCINVVGGANNVLITNCSTYDSGDGGIDIANDATNVTVQYCILGNGKAGWGGCMLITSTNVSVHHNLFVPATSGYEGERCPFVHANYNDIGVPNADIRNNIVWKFGRNNGTGSGYGAGIAYKATANVVNNYFKAGNAAYADDGVMLSDYDSNPGVAYVAGNISEGFANINSVSNHAEYPIPAWAQVPTQSTLDAVADVLTNVGPKYKSAKEIAWIASVVVAGTTPNVLPTANAGVDKSITLPTNSVTLSGSGADSDGNIVSFAWSKVSGGAATIASPTAASTNVTGLVTGNYVFRLTVTDNRGGTATDNVSVAVAAAVNQLPVVSAGSDIEITLPVNAVVLDGTAVDTDGTIASYNWFKVAGGVATIQNPSSVASLATGLEQGVYVFRLTATDNSGGSSSDTTTVTVHPEIVVPPVKRNVKTVTITFDDDETQIISA